MILQNKERLETRYVMVFASSRIRRLVNSYDSSALSSFIFKLVQDTVKIPLEMITPQYYSETGYRFGKEVHAFYISIEE